MPKPIATENNLSGDYDNKIAELETQLSSISEAYSEFLHQIALIHQAIASVSSTLIPREIVERIIDTSQMFFGYSKAVMFKASQDYSTLSLIKTSSENNLETDNNLSLAFSAQMAEKAIGSFETVAEASGEYKQLKKELCQKLNFSEIKLLPLISVNRLVGLLVLGGDKEETPIELSAFDAISLFLNQAAILVHFADIYQELEKTNNQLEEAKKEIEKLTVIDPLTNLHNRRYLKQRAAEEIARAHRYKTPLSYIMIDIDHFKYINDTYGHQEGDYVLSVVGKLLKNNSRGVDITIRYGGEEFLLVLPSTPGEGATILAERIRQKMQATEFILKEDKVPITVSLGVATIMADDNEDSLLNRADQALYKAKTSGRNQVIFYHNDKFERIA